MRPIITDRVAWSVGLWEMAELKEMPFGLRTRLGPVNHMLSRGSDPSGKEQF